MMVAVVLADVFAAGAAQSGWIVGKREDLLMEYRRRRGQMKTESRRRW
jgi:hypothetical protein